MKLTSSPPIKQITTSYSAYGKSSLFKQDGGRIFIEIDKDGLDQKSDLLDLLNNNTDGFAFRAYPMYGPYVLVSDDIEKLRTITDHLYRNDKISASDRSNIEDEIRETEKKISYSKKVEEKISEAQRDVIKFMCEEHIDFLMESLQSSEEKANLVDILDDFPHSWVEYTNKGKQYEELAESLLYLGKIYHGSADLEDTFTKQGSGIPSLENQKEVIKELISSRASDTLKKGKSK